MKSRTIFLSLVALGCSGSALSPVALAGDNTGAVADGVLPLEAGVSLWARYELRDGYDDLNVSRTRFLEGDWFVYRVRLKFISKPLTVGDSGLLVKVYFSPQADGFWGDQPGTVATPDLGIYQGYVSLFNDSFRLDVGRFAMNYGDALIIGDLRWHQTARSFDGVRMRIGKDATAWVDGFFTVLNEGLRAGFNAAGGDPFVSAGNPSILGGDVFFTGVYASLGRLLSKETTLEPYMLAQVWMADETGPRPAVQATGGLRFTQALGFVDLRFEGGLQFGRRRVMGGSNPEVFAYQVDGEVGFNLAQGLRLSLEGLFASGDDPESSNIEGYDEIFPTTHKWLGLMDVIGIRSNVASGVFHARYAIGAFVAKLDGHVFLRPETAASQASYAGFEADINLIFKLTKGMSIRLLYAFFVPGSGHFFVEAESGGTQTANDDLAQYVEVQYGLQL